MLARHYSASTDARESRRKLRSHVHSFLRYERLAELGPAAAFCINKTLLQKSHERGNYFFREGFAANAETGSRN